VLDVGSVAPCHRQSRKSVTACSPLMHRLLIATGLAPPAAELGSRTSAVVIGVDTLYMICVASSAATMYCTAALLGLR